MTVTLDPQMIIGGILVILTLIAVTAALARQTGWTDGFRAGHDIWAPDPRHSTAPIDSKRVPLSVFDDYIAYTISVAHPLSFNDWYVQQQAKSERVIIPEAEQH